MNNSLILFGIASLFIFLLSCNSNKAEEATISGLLYYRNDALIFVPCNEKDVIVNIADNPEKLTAVFKDTMRYYYTGESVYVELKGLLQKPKRKLISDEPLTYNFTVHKLIYLTKRSAAPCDCLYYDYMGGGTGWTFEISEIEEFIALRDDESKQSYYFDYAEPFERNDSLIYVSQNIPTGNKIELKLSIGLQAGELSSEKNYPTHIQLNNKQYIGFAHQCYAY